MIKEIISDYIFRLGVGITASGIIFGASGTVASKSELSSIGAYGVFAGMAILAGALYPYVKTKPQNKERIPEFGTLESELTVEEESRSLEDQTYLRNQPYITISEN